MVDDTGIELEDLASEKELEILTLPFTLKGGAGKSVIITGVALTEGVWKNVIYSAAEIKKVAKALIGKPLLVEHGNTKEFGTDQVGKVVSSYFEPTLKGIIFEAEVTDPLAKRLVKKEVLPAVSCSTWMDKRPINNVIRVGTGYIFAELSLVRIPACDRCFIFHKEQLSALGKEGKHLKVIRSKENDRDEFIMEVESLSEIEREEEELSMFEELEAPKLYAVLELPDEDSLSGLKETKNVVSYYYGIASLNPLSRSKLFKNREDRILLATIELDSKEELAELKLTHKVVDAFYNNPSAKKTHQNLSGDDAQEILAVLKRIVGKQKGKVEEYKPKPTKSTEPAPNPDSCAKIVCPIDDKEFEDEEQFMAHWNEEHKEKYGSFKETMTILAALSQMVDLAKGETKITKMKNGRFMVFKDTGKTGFAQWKIVGNFATIDEARAAAGKAKSIKEEKQYEEEKDKHGCIVGKEEWDEESEKCVAVSKEEQSAFSDHIKKCMKEKAEEIPDPKKRIKACAATWTKEEKSAYTDFIAKCRKDGKSMKECAAGWKNSKGKEEKAYPEGEGFKCPVDGKIFKTEKDLAEHWKEKHIKKYGPLKKDYKYPEKKSGRYFYCKLNGKYKPYYYKDGKYYTKYKAEKK